MSNTWFHDPILYTPNTPPLLLGDFICDKYAKTCIIFKQFSAMNVHVSSLRKCNKNLV